jgi:hypothetical protein
MLAPTYRAGVRLVSVECLHLTGPKQAKRGFKTLALCHDNRAATDVRCEAVTTGLRVSA